MGDKSPSILNSRSYLDSPTKFQQISSNNLIIPNIRTIEAENNTPQNMQQQQSPLQYQQYQQSAQMLQLPQHLINTQNSYMMASQHNFQTQFNTTSMGFQPTNYIETSQLVGNGSNQDITQQTIQHTQQPLIQHQNKINMAASMQQPMSSLGLNFLNQKESPRKRKNTNHNLNMKKKQRLSILRIGAGLNIAGKNKFNKTVELPPKQKVARILNEKQFQDLIKKNKYVTDKIKLMSQSYRWRKFTQKMFEYFNDKSFYNKTFINNNYSSEYDNVETGILQYIPVFQMGSLYKLSWDLIHFSAVIFMFIWIPMYLSFDETINIGGSVTFLGALIIFLIDILIGFNTAYYEQGMIILNRKKIFKNYVDKRMIKDIFSNVPLIYHLFMGKKQVDDGTGANLPSLDIIMLGFFYIKIWYFKVMKLKFIEFFHQKKNFKHFLDLFQLVGTIVLLSHIYACILIYIAQFQGGENDQELYWTSKVILPQGQKLQGLQLYSYAFYFATVTMCSVGYGDISPVNDLEVVICTLFMIIICVKFAYFIGKMGQILNEIENRNNKKDVVLQQVNSYFKQTNLSQELQYSMREYVEYYFSNDLDDLINIENQILSLLNEPLRKKLYLEKYRTVLSQSNIFNQNFSRNVLASLIPIIKQHRCNPGELIFNPYEPVQNIYFITQGKVELFLEENCDKNQKKKINKPYICNTLVTGQDFGTLEFFTGSNSNFGARSKEFSTLLKVNKDEFIQILNDYPEDYEKWCMIKDSVNHSYNFKIISQRCYACNQSQHIASQCPFITFAPNKLKIYNLVNNPPQQVRKDTLRNLDKYQTLKQLQQTVDFNTDFILNNSGDFEQFSWLKDEDEFQSSCYGSDSEDIDFQQMQQTNSVLEPHNPQLQQQLKLLNSFQPTKNPEIQEELEISQENKDEQKSKETSKDQLQVTYTNPKDSIDPQSTNRTQKTNNSIVNNMTSYNQSVRKQTGTSKQTSNTKQSGSSRRKSSIFHQLKSQKMQTQMQNMFEQHQQNQQNKLQQKKQIYQTNNKQININTRSKSILETYTKNNIKKKMSLDCQTNRFVNKDNCDLDDDAQAMHKIVEERKSQQQSYDSSVDKNMISLKNRTMTLEQSFKKNSMSFEAQKQRQYLKNKIDIPDEPSISENQFMKGTQSNQKSQSNNQSDKKTQIKIKKFDLSGSIQNTQEQNSNDSLKKSYRKISEQQSEMSQSKLKSSNTQVNGSINNKKNSILKLNKIQQHDQSSALIVQRKKKNPLQKQNTFGVVKDSFYESEPKRSAGSLSSSKSSSTSSSDSDSDNSSIRSSSLGDEFNSEIIEEKDLNLQQQTALDKIKTELKEKQNVKDNQFNFKNAINQLNAQENQIQEPKKGNLYMNNSMMPVMFNQGSIIQPFYKSQQQQQEEQEQQELKDKKLQELIRDIWHKDNFIKGNFDVKKEFTYYYPRFNYSKIENYINKNVEKLKRESKRRSLSPKKVGTLTGDEQKSVSITLQQINKIYSPSKIVPEDKV